MKRWACGILALLTLALTALPARAQVDANTGAPLSSGGWMQAASTGLITGVPAPVAVMVDTDGSLLVSDYTMNRVLRVNPDGSVNQWGVYGSSPGQLNGPFGLAIGDQRSIYEVDQLNGRVQKFDASGGLLLSWGIPGADLGQFRTPFGIAVGNGRVYVADFGNDRIQVFTTDGQFLQSWGTRGTAVGEFMRPTGLALDHDGNVYVSDYFNNRVEKFAPSGKFLLEIGGLSAGTPLASGAGAAVEATLTRPEGVAVDAAGNVFVADYGADRVVKLGPDGHLLSVIASRGSGDGFVMGPKGIAVDPVSGRIYVADTGNSRIERFAPDGTFEASWTLP